MDFVDDVDLHPTLDRAITNLFDQITDLFYAIVAGRVDFDDVRMGTFV